MEAHNESAMRQALEAAWRLQLEEAQAHYQKAKERYRTLLQEQTDGTSHDLTGALALARHEESVALAEYSRILQTFTELTLTGKVPEGRVAAGQ